MSFQPTPTNFLVDLGIKQEQIDVPKAEGRVRARVYELNLTGTSTILPKKICFDHSSESYWMDRLSALNPQIFQSIIMHLIAKRWELIQLNSLIWYWPRSRRLRRPCTDSGLGYIGRQICLSPNSVLFCISDHMYVPLSWLPFCTDIWYLAHYRIYDGVAG